MTHLHKNNLWPIYVFYKITEIQNIVFAIFNSENVGRPR